MEPKHTPVRLCGAPSRSTLLPVAAAIGALLHTQALHAQTPASPPAVASTVVISAPAPASVAGFGPGPAARSPLQSLTLGNGALADAGVQDLAGLVRLDASVGDAYNAEGYWSILSMRGYTLDNRFNYRRDGLPINAETSLALEAVERLEVLKGTSGIQAGTSAPGGLVNLVVKRPDRDRRDARLEWRETGNVLAAVDLGQRFGADGAFAVRLNLAAERLDPVQRDTRGRRSVAALAADWQAGPATLLQLEAESSRQRQPSVAGYSLLGNRVPGFDVVDVRRNLNAQPWRQDVEFDGDTASLRWQQRLGANWRFSLHALQQRLHTNDRTAFPYGNHDPATFDCDPCDRFAPDGRFTYWEFISDNERRTSQALQAMLSGSVKSGAVEHQLEAGVLRTRYRGRFNDQVFDIAGTGAIDGSLVTPRSSGFLDANTDRDERGAEVFVRDAMAIGAHWQLWLGLRHSMLERQSRRTSPDGDGSLRATDVRTNETTPWLALARQLGPRTMLYASWGRGLETDVAPNRARYTNAGALVPLASRQFEIGLKHGDDRVEAALTLFDIDRGVAADFGACGAAATCTRERDGSARHRGIEAAWQGSAGIFGWQASALWLDAERRGSRQAGVNGVRPVNVPATSMRLGGEVRPPSWPGLALLAALHAEGERLVLPYDASVRIPGWSRLDLGLRWRQTLGGSTLTWRVAVDNATDRRAWKEAPYQFGHVYLYPLAPRTWRASVAAAF